MIVGARLGVAPFRKRLLFGTRLVLDELLATVNRAAGVWASSITKGTVTGVSSGVGRFASPEIVGGLFRGLMVTVNARVVVEFCGLPSLAVIVMTTIPVACSAGVKRSVAVGFGFV